MDVQKPILGSMDVSWFDPGTSFPKPPPDFRLLTYSALRDFYARVEGRKNALSVLEECCDHLRREGFSPDNVVIGGDFIRCNGASSRLQFLLLFPNNQAYHRTSLQQAMNGFIGRNSTQQDCGVEFVGAFQVGQMDRLPTYPQFQAMQKNHGLKHAFYKVSLPVVPFSEVSALDGSAA